MSGIRANEYAIHPKSRKEDENMTKTELSRITRAAFVRNRPVYVRNRYTNSKHRLNRCQAWYYTDEDLNAVALRSYRSIVALYWGGVVWEFDRWSNTTTQHVRKFAHLMDAPVISLYRRSGMSMRDYEAHTACDWSDVIEAVLST